MLLCRCVCKCVICFLLALTTKLLECRVISDVIVITRGVDQSARPLSLAHIPNTRFMLVDVGGKSPELPTMQDMTQVCVCACAYSPETRGWSYRNE